MKQFGLVLLAAASVAANAVRDEKLFSVFQIVKFNNDVCTTTSGGLGTCYTESECTTLGGSKSGNCAAGFGVCCEAKVDSCANTVSVAKMNNTVIESAGYPSDIATGTAASTCDDTASTGTTRMLTYVIQKSSSDIVQYRLDFDDFVIDSPTAGSCANSTLAISGVDAVTSKVLPTNLCGDLTGHHMYLSVKDQTGNTTLTITLNSLGTQKWKIRVSQFDSTQTDFLAPRGCLQYYSESTGIIKSMNFMGTTGEALTDHMYTVCIKQRDDMCDVTMTAATFDLGGTSGSCTTTDDKVVLGVDTFCGATFGTSGTYNWAYSGSYMMGVMTGADNTAMKTGFSIAYLLLPC